MIRSLPKIKAFQKLPCGGHITTNGKGDQVFRVVRELGPERPLVMILLHPPAKGHDDIESCVNFSKASGFGRLTILYLFPYRAADMSDIRKHRVPWGEGPLNRRLQDGEIHRAIWEGGRVIAAWGEGGGHENAGNNFLHRFDGTPRAFSPYPSPVYPIEVLSAEAVAA